MSSNKQPSQEITYTSYLKVDELLGLQEPMSSPLAHDEMLFIVTHQAYELWFKQVLFELESVVRCLEQKDLITSFRRLDRICEIFRVLIQQVDVLETMTPVEFNRFRSHLNPASGFQSWQFRQLELLSGADASEYEKFNKIHPEWADKLKARTNAPSLRTGFFSLLKSHGLLSDDSRETIDRALSEIYEKPELASLQSLCEYLIRYDEQISLWRFRHVQMVERMIGMKRGTGGSLGVNYLKQTLRTRFFPELWDARTQMGEGSNY